MPKALQIKLSQPELEQLLKAYLHERAAAIIKGADGMPASQVAQHGLLKPRQYQRVCNWVRR